ncbi:hypothetical protein D778_01829 [Xanthomarina gelatinilytica]|uniref:Uncharacterized protein n=1 Tax=Xanthomarina gelatinilytica TaxID=1137281 RepID=M7N2H7_9FLAO|nr:hypothetical protein D778_01829 [Xanthomarina gelatinilytica]
MIKNEFIGNDLSRFYNFRHILLILIGNLSNKALKLKITCFL